MATTNTELDPVLRQALQLLHSPSADAAENIRKVLDEIIRQRHGSSKMLVNTLSKKHLAEESQATGSGLKPVPAAVRRQSHKSTDSSSNNSNSSPVQLSTAMTIASGATTATVLTTDMCGQQQEIPVIISLTDSSGNATITVDDNATDDQIMLDHQHLKDLEDLVCVVCRRIDLSAKNRLIECTKCNLLYHQECHTPQIADTELSNDQESSWCCTTCKTKSIKSSVQQQMIASPAKSYSSHSSNSSSSSSSSVSIQPPATLVSTSTIAIVQPATPPTTSSSSSRKDKDYSRSSSSRHHHHSSSTSGGRASGSGSGSSSSKSSITPNINIISADKRLQNMKKKAAKTHESKRKK